jgi:hypothetical protein
MEDKGWLMLRTLLNRYHGGSAEALLKCLSQEDVKTILEQDVHTKDAKAVIAVPEEFLQKVHYSWLLAPIQKTPEILQTYFLAALPEPQAKGVCSLLGKSYEPQPIASPIRSFLLASLYSKLGAKSLIPIPLLPESNLKSLLEVDKNQLVDLINYLGSYDLASVIKKVVDKQKLKGIYSCLSNSQQQFIRLILHHPEVRVVSTEIDIEKGYGDCDAMNKMVHSRGIIRLAKGLSGQSSHFMWHLTRRLDTGRSSILLKNWSKEEIPQITPLIVSQILFSLNFLKKGAGNS